eukprot:TRINITY_DN12223_c0_g1_i1.p1 TRINITY_DN12223_c0_g1~~TRINITY_DN12223_c0_g1_i1.p1  ORF type:complete len:475 (+),score=79.52 TRINITY_DN12223_c0_g1_i1:123-1547(+)
MGCGCSSGNKKTVVLEGNSGSFFRDYKLGAKIGAGAFGQVRAALGNEDGAQYAVKIIDVRHEGTDQVLKKSFLDEARQECKLLGLVAGSENVVMLHECYLEQPGIIYMVMERCFGSLMDRLCHFPNMTEAQMSTMFREMLRGLQALHEVNIVHRDVKLDNFLLGGPNRMTVKLADFGLSAELTQGSLTGVSGTALYMSPEMLAGGSYNTQTDIWSFASTAYVILFGDSPYSPKDATPAAAKEAIMTATPAPTWTRPDKLAGKFKPPPRRAVEFVRYLLNRNPLERPTCLQALQHPFVLEGLGADSGEMIETGARHAKSFTDRFKRRQDPTVQRHLDEVLMRLSAVGPALPAGDIHCFSEADWQREEDDANHPSPSGKYSATSLSCKAEAECRIVARPSLRNHSHSGVVAENSATRSKAAAAGNFTPFGSIVPSHPASPDEEDEFCRPPPPVQPVAPMGRVPEFPAGPGGASPSQ